MNHPVGSIERRITDVIREHAWASSNMGCICGFECFPHEHAPHVAGQLTSELGLRRRNGLEDIVTPTCTEFWHCWATDWERTCTCTAPDWDDPTCPIHHPT